MACSRLSGSLGLGHRCWFLSTAAAGRSVSTNPNRTTPPNFQQQLQEPEPSAAAQFQSKPTLSSARKPAVSATAFRLDEAIKAEKSLQSPDYFQVYNLFTIKDLFEARVHMGHKIGSLVPEMRPFIFGKRFDSLIFDLDITAFHLRQALNFIAHIAYRQGIILFITRSPQTMNLVETTAIEAGEYAHTRAWDTAVFTNSISKFGGITRLPDVVIFLNTLDTVLSTHGAVKDAAKMLIPTVGIVDSNCRPNLISYPIPGNDDSLPAVQLYCKLFKEAILRGKSKRKLEDSKRQPQEKENQN